MTTCLVCCLRDKIRRTKDRLNDLEDRIDELEEKLENNKTIEVEITTTTTTTVETTVETNEETNEETTGESDEDTSETTSETEEEVKNMIKPKGKKIIYMLETIFDDTKTKEDCDEHELFATTFREGATCSTDVMYALKKEALFDQFKYYSPKASLTKGYVLFVTSDPEYTSLPDNYQLIWSDLDSNTSLWRAIAPNGYTALGDVFHTDATIAPPHRISRMLCVRNDLITLEEEQQHTVAENITSPRLGWRTHYRQRDLAENKPEFATFFNFKTTMES